MKVKKINPKKDAYGQLVLARFNNENSYEIIERDDGFIDLMPGTENYFTEFKNWPKHQKEGIKFAKGKILDIGAGAGRIALYLQKKGLKVTAIDNSPLSIKVCKKRGLKDAKVLSIEEIDYFKPSTFDSILLYGNNFGLLSNKSKAKRILKKLHKITKENAIIIAESSNPYKTKDPAHLSYHKLNQKRNKMIGQLKIRIRFRDYIGEWFEYLLVSKNEMKNILQNTGWRVERFIDSENAFYIAIIKKEIIN
jgi:SAM-dependent methyltransferase